MASDRTLIHAVIGAVVGVVLSFIPFSTVVGGAVAGFLEGPDSRAGAIAGAAAGVVAFVPVAAFAVLLLGFLGFGMGVAAAPFEGFAVAAFLILVFALVVLLYTVGLSLLGGYLGASLAREYPRKHRATRRSLGTAADSPSDHRGSSPPDSRGRSADRYPPDDQSTGPASDLEGVDDRRRDWNRDRDRASDRDRNSFDIDWEDSETDWHRENRERERERERERDE